MFIMQNISVAGVGVLLERVPLNCLLLPPSTWLPYHTAGGTTVLLSTTLNTPSPLTPGQNTVAQEWCINCICCVCASSNSIKKGLEHQHASQTRMYSSE